MVFQEFYQRFGGSFRTKHLCLLPHSFLKRLHWCYEFLTDRNQDALQTKRVSHVAKRKFHTKGGYST